MGMLSPVRKAGDQKTHFSDDNHCKSCCACAAPNIKKSVLKFQYILDFPKQLGLQAYSILQAVCKMQRLKKNKQKNFFYFLLEAVFLALNSKAQVIFLLLLPPPLQ